jgi:uncharacterized membrane protein (DUF2068 family)
MHESLSIPSYINTLYGVARIPGKWSASSGVSPQRNAIVFSPAQCEGTIGDVVPAKKRSYSHGDGALLVIAVFKFLKGALLLALAFGALSLLHKNVALEVEHWLDQLRIDPDNEFIGALLSKLQLVHTKELKEISALGAGYAALFLTEGTGLLFRKRWAEWLTIVATSSLMPLEVYELIKVFTVVRLLVVLVNAAVVLFLIYRVRQKEK